MGPEQFKILLVGAGGVGKSSVKRAILDENSIPHDCASIKSGEVEQSACKLCPDVQLTVLECRSKFFFPETGSEANVRYVLSGVDCVVWITALGSIESPSELDCLHQLLHKQCRNRPNATVHVLLHKADLVPERHQLDCAGRHKLRIMQHLAGDSTKIIFHTSSIWDESLYRICSVLVQPIETFLRDHFPMYHFVGQDAAKELVRISLFDKKSMIHLCSFSGSLAPEFDAHLCAILKSFTRKYDCRSVVWKNENFVYSVEAIGEWFRLAQVSNTADGIAILQTVKRLEDESSETVLK